LKKYDKINNHDIDSGLISAGLVIVLYSFRYSSRYEDGLAPINSIAYQEPENDPRNYCYLWVARGPQPLDSV